MAIQFLGNIDSLKSQGTGFFLKETLNKYGNNLYSTYEDTIPVRFNSSSQTLQGVTFSSSDYSKFYYGCYKSSISRWPYIVTYFTIFYKYDGTNPSIKISFPKSFTDIKHKTKNLELTLKVLDVVQIGSETITGKLIPILAFESATALQNVEKDPAHPEWYPPQSSYNPPDPNNFYGWIYPYVIKSTIDSSNVMGDYFGVRTKSTYNVVSPTDGTKLPIFVLDMDLYQAGMSDNATGYDAAYSESCMVSEDVTTDFYTGNKNSTTSPYIQYVVYTENVTDPEDSSKQVTRFHGKTGIQSSGLTGSDYELACGVAFIADNNSYLYTAGSNGVSRLFPNLSADTKTINFNVNTSAGETCDVDKTDVYVGTGYGNGSGGWPDAEKPGYDFDGWYTAASGGTKVEPTDIVTANSATDLYAHFTPITYYITYMSDGTQRYQDSYIVTDNVTLRAALSKSGYQFDGWKLATAVNTWSAGTYSGGQNVGTGKYGNITLVAQWSAVTYIITYVSDGVTVGTQNYTVEDSFNLRMAQGKTGYTFTKWKVTTAAGNWTNGSEYSASAPIFNKYGTITLTAQFEINKYPITYNAPGTSGGTVSTTILINWNTLVTINNAGGSGESNFTVTEAKTITDPTRTGYVFGGYIYDSITNTFTATWIANEYTIAYNYQGGTGGTYKPTSGTYDVSVRISNPTKTGYTFTGWTAAGLNTSTAKYGTSASTISTNWSNGSTKVTAQYFINLRATSGTVTLTATWEAKEYTLSFKVNTAGWPGEDPQDPGNVPATPANRTVKYDGYYAGVGYNTLPGLSTTTGDPDNWDEAYDTWKWDHEFVGWFTDDTFTTMVTASTVYKVDGNSMLYAKWDPTTKKYTVTWKDWDGTVIKSDSDISAGTLIESLAPTDPSRSGYRFIGWQNIPSHGEVRDNYTFTALYQIITYNITYHPADKMTHSNPSTYTIDDTPITLLDPVRAGYDFIKWTSDAAGTQTVTNISTGASGNKEFWAWFVPRLSPFDPKPNQPSINNNYFGLPDDLDDSYNYVLRLSIEGDREELTDFVLPEIQGHFTVDGWENELGPLSGSALISYLDDNMVFPMDVWRCRIYHRGAGIKVELIVYNGDTPIGPSESVISSFELPSQYKPIVSDSHFEEGVQSIYDMNLFTEGQIPRFIGNSKSCILCKLDATNYDSNDREMLYGAVPRRFIVKLNSTEDSWESPNISYEIDANVVSQYITASNVTTKQKIEFTDCPWLLITDAPFPTIEQNIKAKLKIKIFDTRD